MGLADEGHCAPVLRKEKDLPLGGSFVFWGRLCFCGICGKMAVDMEGDESMLDTLKLQTRQALTELLEAAKLEEGDILVVGGSSSEILGEKIGSHSSMETAEVVVAEILSVCREKGICPAFQCCEHLNRAIIMEKATAKQYGYEIVNVVPQPKAGGAFATNAYHMFEQPVAVEHIRAHGGMDIGQTFIGMHMREVCVPVRLSVKKIGEAQLSVCRTRPKFIGGDRACYDERLK